MTKNQFLHRLTPNLTLKIKVKVNILYTILKIKIRAIILEHIFYSPNQLEKNIDGKPILQKPKPKNHVLTLKIKAKVNMLYTVLKIKIRAIILDYPFPPPTCLKENIHKKTLCKNRKSLFWPWSWKSRSSYCIPLKAFPHEVC